MTNKEILRKQIIYRSNHRGSKEMDILLGQFTKKHIKYLDNEELKDLYEILSMDDNILYEWYFNKINNKKINNNKISQKLRTFKL